MENYVILGLLELEWMVMFEVDWSFVEAMRSSNCIGMKVEMNGEGIKKNCGKTGIFSPLSSSASRPSARADIGLLE